MKAGRRPTGTNEPRAYHRSQLRRPSLLRLPLAAGAVVAVLLGGCQRPPAPAPTEAEVAVDLGTVVNRMRGGIGASWHAIEEPIPLTRGRTEGGSAWGGNPPADDDGRWEQLWRHVDWLGLDWSRVELEQRMYEPERQRFDWDNPEMRILYRILDGYEERGVEVFLQQMWANVAWNTFPEWRDLPARRVHSGPLSVEDFAAGLAALAQQLVVERGYRSIRWLAIVNEPGERWSWWLQPPRKRMPLTPALAAVRRALDERGVELPLAAPGWTYLPHLDPAKIDFDPLVGAYDLHSYLGIARRRRGSYSLAEAERRTAEWVRWAHDRGKPFFLSEVGTMAHGWRGNDPGPGTFEAGLDDAEMVVRGLGVGVDAFNRWSLVNRGDLDGQWQLIDSWDVAEQRLRPTFTPHPNSYYLWGLLTRFTARRSQVLAVTVAERDRAEPGARSLLAAALRSPGGELTVLLVHRGAEERHFEISLEGIEGALTLHRYCVTAAWRDRADLRIEPQARFDLGPGEAGFEDRLDGPGVCAYSTWELGHEAPGVVDG